MFFFLLFYKVCREAFSARALRGDRSGLTALMTALEWGGHVSHTCGQGRQHDVTVSGS